MPVAYALHPIKITGNPDDYQAVVHFTHSVNLEGVIERMVQGNSAISRAHARAMVESYHAAIISLVLEGCKVITPTANYGFSITGLFGGPEDTFSPDRHRVEPTVSVGAELRRDMHQAARPLKLESITPEPHPQHYTDAVTNSRNHLVTPGQLARLNGYRLKFDPADPDQGIFFVAADGTASRVDLIAQNKPRQLIFMNPTDLSPGQYTLEVRSAFKDDLRRGYLLATLEVI